jgi:DNA-binding NarL/FixJ family response regulator
VRVVIADDNLIVRQGVAALLRGAGVEMAAEAASADELVRAVDAHAPDVAIVDVRMPPTHTDEGLQAALAIRARHPAIGVVVLSQHVEAGLAMRLLAQTPAGLGYVLKERVTDVEEFMGALRRVAPAARRSTARAGSPGSPRASGRSSRSSPRGAQTRGSPSASSSPSAPCRST